MAEAGGGTSGWHCAQGRISGRSVEAGGGPSPGVPWGEGFLSASWLSPCTAQGLGVESPPKAHLLPPRIGSVLAWLNLRPHYGGGPVRGRKEQMGQKKQTCPQQSPRGRGAGQAGTSWPKRGLRQGLVGWPGSGWAGLGWRAQLPRQRQEGPFSSKLPACALFKDCCLV